MTSHRDIASNNSRKLQQLGTQVRINVTFVLVLGANIAVLLDCSKPSRQCSLSYLLTYFT